MQVLDRKGQSSEKVGTHDPFLSVASVNMDVRPHLVLMS